MAEISSSQAMRSSTERIERRHSHRQAAEMYRARSWRKYHAAPTKVPTCNATSNVLLRLGWSVSSVHSNSSGTRMRWPLDEIGRNSERPCTIPKTIAWMIGTAGEPRGRRSPAGHQGGVLGRDQRQCHDRGGRERKPGRVVLVDEERDTESATLPAGLAAVTGAALDRGRLVVGAEHQHAARRHHGRRSVTG